VSDRRATLEAIAYGTDARITPGDRIRALEQLASLDTKERESFSVDQLLPKPTDAVSRDDLGGLRDSAPGGVRACRRDSAVSLILIRPPCGDVVIEVLPDGRLAAASHDEGPAAA
jgi:hypothetical protein